MGMFGAGGTGRNIAGYVGDALLSASGNKPIYGPLVQQRAENQQALLLAQMKAQAQNSEQPASVKALLAAGIDPRSPQGQRIISDNLSAPRYLTLGSPETGQQVINPGAMPQQAGPPQEAVARLRANPAEAAQFDEIFGAGASARALGGQ